MGEKVRASLVSLRDLFATAWPIMLVVAIGFIVAIQFIKPAPPKRVVMSTGNDSGAYYAFGKKYAEILARSGITLEVRTSAGSGENLKRLLDENDDVQIALVQGGVDIPRPVATGEEAGAAAEPPPLLSLGSMYYEPVWVFYRGDKDLDRLHQLAGKRIAVGAEGSGIRGLALQLLSANEVPVDAQHLLSLGGLKAAEELQQGRIDAAFVIAAPEAPVVQVLLRSPGVKVMNFSQAEAYTRRFPYLSKITLPEGAVDLVRNFPPKDTVLLAATANLIVSDGLHPAIQSLLLQAASEVHGQAGFFQHRGDFPAVKDQSLPVAAAAERYYKSGPPFLQRYLPFWAAILVDRLVVLLLPVFALLLPLLKVAPSIYSWRVRSKIFRCYGDLKFLENEIKQDYDPGKKLEYLDRLDRIEDEAYRRNIPLAYSDLFYTLREHIDLVRHTLDRLGLQERKAREAQEANEAQSGSEGRPA